MRKNETTAPQITIGSLFSGIGGLELGLEAAGLGPVLWQVEKDPFCRSILAKRWPDVDRYTDVRDVGGVHAIDCDLDGYCFAQGDCSGVLQSVDLICGGFPCQDVSHPGRRAGIEGTQSGLWFEMQRIICELRPRFVCVENSAGIATRGLGAVIGGLSSIGYDAIWFPVRAHDIGAPHGRARTWILAYPDSERFEAEPVTRLHAQRQPGDDAHRCGGYPPRRGDEDGWRSFTDGGGPSPGVRRGADGYPTALDRSRLRALGNAVVPGVAQLVGEIVLRLEASRAP